MNKYQWKEQQQCNKPYSKSGNDEGTTGMAFVQTAVEEESG